MNLAVVFSPINVASFSFGAILVCLTCLVYMALRGRYEKIQSKLLFAVIIILLVNAVSSMTAEVLKEYAAANDAAALGVRVANYLYFVAHTALAPLIAVYCVTVCGKPAKRNAPGSLLTAVPFLVTEAMAILNPLLHWVYYYGPSMAFTRNWAVYVIYVVAGFYILYGLIVLFRGWRALTRVKRLAIAYFFVMVLFGVLVQLVVPEVRIELFAESVGLLGLMLFVENEDDLIDFETGVYNRNALKKDIDLFLSARNPTYAIVVRVTNADAFTRIAGSSQARQYMVSAVARHIKEIVPWYRVYRTAPAQYALFDPTIDEQAAIEVANRISNRFERSWDYHGVAIDLHAVVSIARIPDDLGTPNDVFYFVDSPVPPTITKKVLGRSDLGYLMRQAEVERAVQQGLTDSNYEVYYQPVLSVGGGVVGAEALMRLHDPSLGDVPPYEFIEVAERIDLIEDIGDFALREACAFLASGVPEQLGLDWISVNLSVIQCMKADLPERIRGIVEEFGIEPRAVSFEITESVAAGNYEFLGRTMAQIREDGHRFAMDDYGTGYSNMHSLLTLDFDTVKIDKGVLWDAEKSDTGMAVLENSVQLLRNIGRLVLVEGVETEVQASLLQGLGVDFLQGFHFSKPLPQDEFVAFVEQRRASGASPVS